MKLLHTIYLTAQLIILASCSPTKDDSASNEIDISQKITPFETDTIQIGGNAHIYTSDSLIIIGDPHSKDMILTLVDLHSLETIGQIAKFGAGPDEISVPGAIYIDNDGKSISVFDYGQLKIATYNIDSALVSADYAPIARANFTMGQFPDRYVHVNDTLGFARSITMNPKIKGYSQGLCKYNITTGELTEISDPKRMEGLKSLFGIYVPDGIIAEGATNNDILNIYDFQGTLLHEILGPEYQPQVSNDKVFFRQIRITPDYILAAYSGREGEKAYSTDKIRVYNHDGNYIKTLIVGKDLTDMAYDKNLNRLFCVFNNEDIQFGYIDLENIL